METNLFIYFNWDQVCLKPDTDYTTTDKGKDLEILEIWAVFLLGYTADRKKQRNIVSTTQKISLNVAISYCFHMCCGSEALRMSRW